MWFSASCKKDFVDNENTYPANTSSNGALANFIAQNAPPVQQFIINANIGGTIYGLHGTILQIAPGAFMFPNGNPASGNVTVELIEVFSKKEIITSGAFTTSGGVPIQSGGEVKINAWQGTQELELSGPGFISAYIPAGTNPIANMQLFTADEVSAGQDFDLRESIAVTIVADTSTPGPLLYNYLTFPPNLGWTNCDQYMSNASSLVPYSVSIPAMFNQLNSLCYISFNDCSAVAHMYFFEPTINTFVCGSYYRMPVGFDVTFIAISEINGQFYYAEQQLIVGQTCSISLVPQPCTQAYIDQKLNSL